MGLQVIGGLKFGYSKSLLKLFTSVRTGCEISKGTEIALSIMCLTDNFQTLSQSNFKQYITLNETF